jgi:hypothetical protein
MTSVIQQCHDYPPEMLQQLASAPYTCAEQQKVLPHASDMEDLRLRLRARASRPSLESGLVRRAATLSRTEALPSEFPAASLQHMSMPQASCAFPPHLTALLHATLLLAMTCFAAIFFSRRITARQAIYRTVVGFWSFAHQKALVVFSAQNTEHRTRHMVR